MDIVDRLRKFGDNLSVERFTVRETSLEAADEIERLRNGYRRLRDATDTGMRDGDLAREIADEMLNDQAPLE